MVTVFLALGSNVGDSRQYIEKAIELLGEKVSNIKTAPLYRSAALPVPGHDDLPDFLNTAIAGETDLGSQELLEFVKNIEQEIGRIYRFRWGPREIDIDIIFYDNLILETPELTIPHISANEREFVLQPIADIDPNFIDPRTNQPVEKLLAQFSASEIMRISTVQLVGILNVTPDSFSDGGNFLYAERAIEHGRQLIQDGASIIDVGAESTRPNAMKLTADEEWQRLEKVLPELLREFPGQVSLDTYHPETVRKAAQIGPVIVNDVTGFNNSEMVKVAAEFGLRCIVSHLPEIHGQDIQAAHTSALIDSIDQVKSELLNKRQQMIEQGIAAENIILDPGIGFGKTPQLNWNLLEFAGEVPGIDVMIGYSRKRFLGEQRMEIEPNLEAGKIAIESGAKYLRVHDVTAHIPLV